MKIFACVAAFALICGLPFSVSAQTAKSSLKNLAPVSATKLCEMLGHTDFSTIKDAPTQISGAETLMDAATGTTYCHVTGFVAPQVRFEMKLPATTWTQRLLMTGCGGLCGSIGMRVEHANDCLPAHQGELAIVATDMGHEGQGGLWAQNDPELRTDFAYRGVHVVTLAAKAIITNYYGQAQAYAYFSGCSDGGREALMEAERYPADFDGIAAGAPAANFAVQNSFYHAWNAVSNTGPDGQPILTAAQLPILHAAAIKACDMLDGIADGLIADPTRCHFDPATAQCAPAAPTTDNCLTAPQVEATRKIYAGAHDGKGNRFVVGAPMPGSEMAWLGVEVTFAPGMPLFGYGASEDSIKYLLNWPSLPADWHVQKDMAFDLATFNQMTASNDLYGATDPDLSAYFNRGGRLLLWHGWSDQHISPINSIAYYRAVETTLGADATRKGMRFYLFPGLYHCGGGDGLNQFDVLTPIMQWVETGRAPDTLSAGHVDQQGMPAMPPSSGAKSKMAMSGPPLAATAGGMPPMMKMSGPPSPAPELPIINPVTVKPYPMLADFAAGDKKVNGYEKFSPATWAGEALYTPYKHAICAWDGSAYTCKTSE